MLKNKDGDTYVESQLPILRLKPHDIVVIRSNQTRSANYVRRLRGAIQASMIVARIDFPVGILYIPHGIEIGLQPEFEAPTPSDRIKQDAGNEPPCPDVKKVETYLLSIVPEVKFDRVTAIDQLIRSHQQQREIVEENGERHRRIHRRFRWLPFRLRHWLQGN